MIQAVFIGQSKRKWTIKQINFAGKPPCDYVSIISINKCFGNWRGFVMFVKHVDEKKYDDEEFSECWWSCMLVTKNGMDFRQETISPTCIFTNISHQHYNSPILYISTKILFHQHTFNQYRGSAGDAWWWKQSFYQVSYPIFYPIDWLKKFCVAKRRMKFEIHSKLEVSTSD